MARGLQRVIDLVDIGPPPAGDLPAEGLLNRYGFSSGAFIPPLIIEPMGPMS